MQEEIVTWDDSVSLKVEGAPLGEKDLLKAPHEGVSTKEKFQVVLPVWQGPYDILLQVIDEQELNLLDLDISKLLDHYLAYLEDSEVIDVDEAGEFLVVGATLAQIKSKLLLPKDESIPEEEEVDPRADLVRYLQEYQKIKQAADLLRDRPLLGRDVFVKGLRESFEGFEASGKGTLFQLVKGFQNVLKATASNKSIQLSLGHISVSDRMHAILEELTTHRELSFEDLLKSESSSLFVIVSFLGILELVRLKRISIIQGSEQRLYIQIREANSDSVELVSEFDEQEPEEDAKLNNEALVHETATEAPETQVSLGGDAS